jgi:ankyrin repeat protein
MDALICAAAGDAAIVKRLMGAGADIKRSAKDGTTALKRATATGHTVVAETLEAEMRLRAELG